MINHSFFAKNRLIIIETFAVVFYLLYTVLLTYGIIFCWPAALLGASLYIYLCYEKKLFAETALQVFYFVSAIYGWASWSASPDFEIISLGINFNAAMIFAGFAFVGISGFLLRKHTKAALPFVDSFTTIFSITGTFLMIYVVLENWLYFIVINAVSIFLYSKRKLYLTSLLYFIYLILTINGFISWFGEYK